MCCWVHGDCLVRQPAPLLSIYFRSHREGMRGQKPYLSVSDRFCILGQKTQSLGQDFVAARCLPVRDIKGTECKTVVRVQKHWQCWTPATALLPSKPTTECSQGAPASTAWLQRTSLQCTSVGLYKTLPFVHSPAYDEAFFCRLHSESSVTCQALLASKDAQRASLLCLHLFSRA